MKDGERIGMVEYLDILSGYVGVMWKDNQMYEAVTASKLEKITQDESSVSQAQA